MTKGDAEALPLNTRRADGHQHKLGGKPVLCNRAHNVRQAESLTRNTFTTFPSSSERMSLVNDAVDGENAAHHMEALAKTS